MAEKWTFEKLHAADEERCRKHKEEFADERLKVVLDKVRYEWYDRYNKTYQDGFEALLAEAGWERYEYCNEYENRIGFEVGAGHPAYFMTHSQRLSAGLRLLVKTDKKCEIAASEDHLRVRGDWSKMETNDRCDIQRFGFKLENGVYVIQSRESW